MAGLPGLVQTRSLSRYGLSQVTVIFRDGTDIHFARQLVSQRIQDARAQLPAGVAPQMGPISTGLGEIYLWTVEAEPDARKPDGTPYTATDLREIQDWVIKPQLRTVPGVTEINTIGGFAKEYLVAPEPGEAGGATACRCQHVVQALERNNGNVGAGYIERRGEQYLVRAPGQVKSIGRHPRRDRRRTDSGHADPHPGSWPMWAWARSCAPARPPTTAARWCSARSSC